MVKSTDQLHGGSPKNQFSQSYPKEKSESMYHMC